MQLKDLFHWQQVAGQPMVMHDITLTMLSRLLIVRLPWGAGVWHRPTKPSKKQPGEEASQPQSQQISPGEGGMGGGGGSSGRPVAIIIIGPDGITISPAGG